MGKYMMTKAKTTSDVSVMEVSQSSLGVRTRAKTLALQRSLTAPSTSKSDSCYLQLRSRRLEKHLQKKNSRKARHSCGPKTTSFEECFRSGSVGLEIEASFGENNLDSEARERSTRESTPCSLIKAADTMPTPGSTTKKKYTHAGNQRTQNSPLTNLPAARELEELFGHEERSKQLIFIEKYNFDVVNDLPLPGRYEWVRVTP
ncbi:hypothetical protein RD792_009545 [Penstemon davidsonii]|uniref:Cyclin-dependent kinase inhibitor n=1 Tax=Penstemon davidsonii TaxID=160366 RepID=A0ABR0CZL2_9LAMI|nr:hypothetical protein RD792_009545 [Penstemon davidsonii]